MEVARRFRTWLVKDAPKLAFQLVMAAASLMLIASLGREFLKPAADEKLVATLVACLFAAAFLAVYGKDLAGRIKKIGPIEILEVQRAVRELDGIAEEALQALAVPSALSGARKFYYEEGEKFLTYLKYSGFEPEEGAARDVFWELLYKIGVTAMKQQDWMKSARWLKHLEKISKGAYKSAEISSYIAFSMLFSAPEEAGALREKHLRETVERLSRLAASAELDWTGYFWLAYAQDDLEQWFEAVLSNLEALNRRPRLAPARYNLASSLLKLGRYNSAYWQLKNIGLEDEEVEQVTAGVANDQDMKARIAEVRDPAERRRLEAAMDRLKKLSTGL